ncbi:hypothetical protein DXG01_014122 [Tephrocybe rancida]|nr:hypothetical protein DXG01_014122 [Tephrocybe rancida]
MSEDAKIKVHNMRLKKAHTSLANASAETETVLWQLVHVNHNAQPVQYQRLVATLEKACRLKDTAKIKFEKEIASGLLLTGTGLGKITPLTT